MKTTHRAVKILLKEMMAKNTFLNPALFEFDVWNPGGYVVLTIGGKKGTISEEIFESKSIMVNKVDDLSLDQWQDIAISYVYEIWQKVLTRTEGTE